MNKDILALIGITDTLIHLLQSGKKEKKNAAALRNARRLENVRHELIAEGLRQSRILGAARDLLVQTTQQIGAHVDGEFTARELDWIVRDLLTMEGEDKPPVVSSSSSSGSGPTRVAPRPRRLVDQALRNNHVADRLRRNRIALNGHRGHRQVEPITFPDGQTEQG